MRAVNTIKMKPRRRLVIQPKRFFFSFNVPHCKYLHFIIFSSLFFSWRPKKAPTVTITLSDLCKMTRFQHRLLDVFKTSLVVHEKAQRELITEEVEDIMTKIDFLEQQLIKVDYFILSNWFKHLFSSFSVTKNTHRCVKPYCYPAL